MPLSRRARFNWWIVVVVAALAAPLWMLIGGATAEMRVAAAIQSSAALAAMVWLLATTPRNAIRLPVWLSLAVVWIGVLWHVLVSDAAAHLFGGLFLLIFPAATIGAAFQASRDPVRRQRSSPWDWATFLWHPLLWALPWPRFDEFHRPGVLRIIGCLVPLAVPFLLMTRWRLLALPVFVISVALMFALARWS